MSQPCNLTVIKMIKYDRTAYYDELRYQSGDQIYLQWILPSPNMPTLETALVYPGNGIFEGTNLSEGRGTTKPF